MVWKIPVRAYFAKLVSSRFRRNAFVLMRANIITQAALLLATPILTRLFEPEDFGAAGLFSVVAAFFVAFASLRFEWSIPSARTEAEARSLAALGLTTTVGVALLLSLAIAIFGSATLLDLVGLGSVPLAWLMPLIVVASSMISILTSLYIRERRLEPVAHARYAQSGAQLLTSLSTGFWGFGAAGLVYSYVLAACSGALVLLRKFPFDLYGELLAVKKQIRAGRQYVRQACTSTAVSVVNFAFGSSLPLLLSFSYSLREVGFYFVAMRLAKAPATFIASGISSSFWGEAAALAKSDPLALRRLYLRLTGRLALISIPIVAGCISAPLFLPLILGHENWDSIGIVVAACTPQIVGIMVFSSTNHLIVYDRQSYQLASDILSVLGSVAVLIAARAYDLPFWMAVLGMSSVILAAYVLRFALHLKANNEFAHALAQR